MPSRTFRNLAAAKAYQKKVGGQLSVNPFSQRDSRIGKYVVTIY